MISFRIGTPKIEEGSEKCEIGSGGSSARAAAFSGLATTSNLKTGTLSSALNPTAGVDHQRRVNVDNGTRSPGSRVRGGSDGDGKGVEEKNRM